MQVALIGAPGSGKTRLARALLRGPLEGGKLIDNYVKNVERRYDLACGSAGTWVANTAVAFERYGQERKVAEAPHVVTCGTLIETSVYEAISAIAMGTRPAAIRCTEVMNVLAMLVADTWRYDYVFYLPLAKGVTKHNTMVDEEIPYALERTRLEHVVLTGGTVTERLRQAREVFDADV